MPVAVSTVCLDVQRTLDDNSVPSLDVVLAYVNEARRRLAADAFWYKKTVSSTLPYGRMFFGPLDDIVRVEEVVYSSGGRSKVLDAVASAKYGPFGNGPSSYWLENGVLMFDSPVVEQAEQSTLSSYVSASDAEMTIANAASFPSQGRVVVDSEVIFYGAKVGDRLVGLMRGQEGTTAAAHSQNAIVRLRNLVVRYSAFPPNLAAGGYLETELEPYWQALVYYAAYRSKLQDTDDVGGFDGAMRRAQMFRAMYDEEVNRVRYRTRTAGGVGWRIREV